MVEPFVREWYGEKVIDRKQLAHTRRIHPAGMSAMGGLRLVPMRQKHPLEHPEPFRLRSTRSRSAGGFAPDRAQPVPSDCSAGVGEGVIASGIWTASRAMTVPSLAGLLRPVFRSVTVCTPYGSPSIATSRPNVPADA